MVEAKVDVRVGNVHDSQGPRQAWERDRRRQLSDAGVIHLESSCFSCVTRASTKSLARAQY